ncbi:MAG: sensor histidine kinase [Chloroflexota bacterium]
MKPYYRIPFLYFLIASLWILLSDQALASLFPEPDTYQQAQTYKGWFFVTVTAALLAFLVRAEWRREIEWREKLLQQQSLLEKMVDELKQSADEARQLASRLADVEERERKILARELHDRVGQSLTAMNITLNIVASQLPEDTPPAALERLKQAQRFVEETMNQIRDVMAILRPPVIDEYGLCASLNWLAEQFQVQSGITCHTQCEKLSPRLEAGTEIAFYRIAQSALDNVARHAQATRVEIHLQERDQIVEMLIADNGKGFSFSNSNHLQKPPNWGLKIMEERALAVGATMRVDSAPDKGTRIIVTLRRGYDHSSSPG